MRYTFLEGSKDGCILIARILLMLLYVIFGWNKLVGFSATVAYMTSVGLPLPVLTAGIALVMEFVVGLAIVVGFYTRPLALLLAIYTVGAAVIGHQFWNMVDPDRAASMINFYKNVSIAGGLLLLCITGPGSYSIDKR